MIESDAETSAPTDHTQSVESSLADGEKIIESSLADGEKTSLADTGEIKCSVLFRQQERRNIE